MPVLADENRQRHAPGALARQHPIRLVRDHALDPVLARWRRPSRAFNRVDRKRPQRLAALRIGERPIHGQKPLGSIAEDHRRLRPPAVRILVLEPAARDERPGLDQRIDDSSVGVADLPVVGDDALAFEARRLFGEGAVFVDRIGNAGLDPALLKKPCVRRPELEVLAPVAGSGVNKARACIFRHVVAVEQRDHKPVALRMKRVGAGHRGERIPLDLAEKLERRDPRRVKQALGQRLRKDVCRPDLGPIVGGRIRHPVAPIGDAAGEGDRAVARNRPRRRGPDDDGGVLGLDRERGIDRVADMVFVLDLGLRERRLLDDAPHHWLRAAIEQPVGDEFEDFPRDLGFGGIAHRRVGMIPIADDAQPLEFLALHRKPMFRIGAAFPAKRDDGLRIREVGLGPCPCFDRILPRPSIRSGAHDSPSRGRSWIPGPSSDANGRRCP